MKRGGAKSRSSCQGITLVEMMLVVALAGLLVGISFPAVTSGIDSLRLSAATDASVSFLNAALNRAERRQTVMEVTVIPSENALVQRSAEPGFSRRLDLPEGIRCTRILPEIPGIEADKPRAFLLFPGGTAPRVGLELANRRGVRRIVRVDPLTGVPVIERPAEEP